jgi:hypothetical protein
VSFIVCAVLCAVFRLIVVLFCVMCVVNVSYCTVRSADEETGLAAYSGWNVYNTVKR